MAFIMLLKQYVVGYGYVYVCALCIDCVITIYSVSKYHHLLNNKQRYHTNEWSVTFLPPTKLVDLYYIPYHTVQNFDGGNIDEFDEFPAICQYIFPIKIFH